MAFRPLRYFATVLGLAAVYYAAAKLGLSMGVAEQVTPVWPPAGIALAAIVLQGFRVWPGITLGAFLANVTANEPLATACGIAAGNTLEALAGAWLLNRALQFHPSLDRLTDVVGLVVLAAGLAPIVAATIGVVSLCLGGVQPWGSFGLLWSVWWLGDATGVLIVTPVILAWVTPGLPRHRWSEAVVLVLAVVLVALIVFGAWIPSSNSDRPLEYSIFPFVVWSALRFGQRGAATVTLLASAIAVWGTLNGHGPFSRAPIHESLVLLQSFMAAVAVTGLILSGALSERDLADRRRAIDLRVTHILADSASPHEATPRILREICEELDWDVGAMWQVDSPAGVLRNVQVWHRPDRHVSHFLTICRETTFASGNGLPGRVWATGRPAWIPDVTADNNFPRAPAAVKDGLHGALAFPVLLGREVLAVIEFFSHEIRSPDPRLLQVFAAIGSQVGQFIDRKRAEEAVHEANQRKDEFLAMLGHELRNPLAPIRNALHILQLPGKTAVQVEQLRDIMAGQVEHMTRLVDDLLDVSRIMRGRIELRRERVNLTRVVERAVQTARPAIDSHGHELTVALPPEPIGLDGDVVRLTQIFANLLNNAAKFIDGEGQIRLTAEQVDGEVIVRVRDNGIGIPADVLPHVFDLFVQANRSIARSQSGLGIGLTLVRRLVELHRGTVQVHSDGPGRGCEFVVRLPIARIATPAETKPSVELPPQTAPRRVLVVDDNVDAAESLAMLLRLQGHVVRTVHDGRSVLSTAREFQPNVLLLDLGLPGKTGYEVAKELRDDSEFANLVIAAVTGYGQDEDRRKTTAAGFNYHLVKPVEPALVQRVLDDAAPRRSPGEPVGGGV